MDEGFKNLLFVFVRNLLAIILDIQVKSRRMPRVDIGIQSHVTVAIWNAIIDQVTDNFKKSFLIHLYRQVVLGKGELEEQFFLFRKRGKAEVSFPNQLRHVFELQVQQVSVRLGLLKIEQLVGKVQQPVGIFAHYL